MKSNVDSTTIPTNANALIAFWLFSFPIALGVLIYLLGD
jgi:hypothetical protein